MNLKSAKNILVLTYWSFKEGLIQTYTLPYLYIILEKAPPGSKIYLFTLEKESFTFSKKEKENMQRELLHRGIVWMPYNYFSFGFEGILKWGVIIPRLVLLIFQMKINYLHTFCTPPGMIGYILAFFTGKMLVLDSYEPHAEAMVENKEWKKNSLSFKILFLFEKLQTKKAAYVISATKGMKQYALDKYNMVPENFFVKPACVNFKLFSRDNIKNKGMLNALGMEEKIVCVYAGKFGGIYLDNEVFDFFEVCYKYWGEQFRVLILTNHSEEEIHSYCDKGNLPKHVVHSKFVLHNEIPDYLGLGDFAITPVKPIPTKRYCTPIKDGEYWALGLPVVITKNISDDSEIIEKNGIGSVLGDFSTSEYLRSVKEIDLLLKNKSKEELFCQIRDIAIKYRSFSIAHNIYQEIYA